ncbi:Clr5 domain-containing protein [Xylariomycetidae sp. FL0641]|nr:Clr5 domain-containing protein [Xylariomycetidae sp. FL0641]
MTKPWEAHRKTIIQLYNEKTLSTVRETMIKRHNFKASTRAYRGRLIRWGIRKYNCKKQNGPARCSFSGPVDPSSGSDEDSPTIPHRGISTENEPGEEEAKVGSMMGSPHPLDPSRASTSGNNYSSYFEGYDENRTNNTQTQSELYAPWCAPMNSSIHSPDGGFDQIKSEEPETYIEYSSMPPSVSNYTTAGANLVSSYHPPCGAAVYYQPSLRGCNAGHEGQCYVPRSYGQA